jgi:hypothetical protein
MSDELVDRLLAERDELGIVTAARAKRQAYRPPEPKAAAPAVSPDIRAAVRRAVDARLKEEIERIIAVRMEQSAQEIATINRPCGPSLKTILATVADVTGVSVGDMQGPCRMRRLAWPRHFAFHVVKRTRPDLSLPNIGRAFGNRDHTTVMHGLKKVAENCDQRPFKEWLAHPSILALLKKADES